MIDHLRAYLQSFPAVQRTNRLREYLQWLILRSINQHQLYKHLAFVGGTALRIIYDTGRFSEDLDYTLLPGKTFIFHDMAGRITEDMTRLGLACNCYALKESKAVQSCFFRFSHLLHPLELSANTEQKLSIKVEVDANPPYGGVIDEYFHPGPLMFSVLHHDLPSLFAGKLHALLFRPYSKGRDFYDLMFFLSKRIPFNLTLLKNAAAQTDPDVNLNSAGDCILLLKERLRQCTNPRIANDLAPFLLHPDDIHHITLENLIRAIDQNVDAGILEQ